MLFLLALKSSGLWKIDGEASVIGEEHVILSTEQLLDLRRIRRFLNHYIAWIKKQKLLFITSIMFKFLSLMLGLESIL